MNTETIIEPKKIFRIGIINIFIFIALLRLTNFNFYLSQFLGFETEINNTGGNAFNFINYIGVALLGIILFTKIRTLKARWKSAWPIYVIMGIYLINALVTPYANYSWLIYQEIFLTIALVLHIYIQKVSPSYVDRFIRGTKYFFAASIAFVIFSTFMILSQNSLGYYVQEFNEVFVQSLDDYGIMKQRYGYLLGFLVSYIFFILKGWPKKVALLFLIAATGFGIRSFLIGMVGAIGVFTVRRKKQFLFLVGALIAASWFILLPQMDSLIYDTRFYSFKNGYDIILKFPFGVGLGGYPIYTEEYHRQLFAAFRDVSAVLDYIPLAPESDLVHLFGSLGLIFGGMHLVLQLRLIWFTYVLQPLMSSFQKCIMFYFCFMTFFGISEDSIFSINYWVFFGLASGIVASLLYKKSKLSHD